MKIAIISGSVRIGRQSHKAAYFIRNLLQEHGLETDVVDLYEAKLPLMEERAHLHPQLPEEVKALQGRLIAADGFVMVTPEYHGSYSGALKNALDYFSSEFRKKPAAVAGTSGGAFGGINAATQLQQLLLGLGMYCSPVKLLIPEVQNAFDDDYRAINPRTAQSSERFITEFIWLAEAIAEKKKHVAESASQA